MDKEFLIKLISNDSSLCNHWAAGKCYYPEGWRNKNISCENGESFSSKYNSLPDCICKPGNKDILCDKCEPDSILLESRPSLFEDNSED